MSEKNFDLFYNEAKRKCNYLFVSFRNCDVESAFQMAIIRAICDKKLDFAFVKKAMKNLLIDETRHREFQQALPEEDIMTGEGGIAITAIEEEDDEEIDWKSIIKKYISDEDFEKLSAWADVSGHRKKGNVTALKNKVRNKFYMDGIYSFEKLKSIK